MYRQDIVIDEEFDGKDINEPVSWYDGFKANVAYFNMPLIEHFQEAHRFGKVKFDSQFNAADHVKEEFLPYYKDLARAKNLEHLRYIENRLQYSNKRRQDASNAPITSMIAAGFFDPAMMLMFFPGLNAVLAPAKGLGMLQKIKKGAQVGAGFGAVSELRRAPFEVGDTTQEIVGNLSAPVILGGAFGALGHAMGGSLKRLQSTENKLNKLRNGYKITHGKLDDGKAPLGKQNMKQKDYESINYSIDSSIIQSPTAKRMSEKGLNNTIKGFFGRLIYNGSVAITGNRNFDGFQSMNIKLASFRGKSNQVISDIQEIALQDRNKQLDFDTWFETMVDKYLIVASKDAPTTLKRKTKQSLTKAERESIDYLKKFFREIDDDAHASGAFKGKESMKLEIARLEDEIKLLKESSKVEQSPAKLIDIKVQLDVKANALKALKRNVVKPTNRKFTFPMYYDKRILSDDTAREEFTELLTRHYEKERKILMPNAKPVGVSAREDAERTVARIMNEEGSEFEEFFDLKLMDKFADKHLRHRKTNLAEWQASKFIHKSKDVIYNYLEKMGTRIAFAENYNGRTPSEIIDEIKSILKAEGKSDEYIAKVVVDWVGEFDRAVGNLRRDPTSLSNQAIKALSAWTGWAYLGQAGVAAISDTGSVIFAHGAQDTLKAGINAFSDMTFNRAFRKEMNAMNEIWDWSLSATRRFVLEDKLNRLEPTFVEKVIEKGNKLFYTLNGLGPITYGGKFLNGMLVSDKFIKLSRKWSNGTATDFDKEFLMRYGFDEQFAKFVSKAPTETHLQSKMEFANTLEWSVNTPQAREYVRRFRNAVAQHNSNTIVWGQAFDKPRIVDGVLYIKDNPLFRSIRKKFPTQLKIDRRASVGNIDYVRIDSGIMTAPFLFMNFAFGANNKILKAMKDPMRAHKIQGAISLLSLSYVSLWLKYGDWFFEDKDPIETMARVVDHSGLLGIYGDLGYMGLETIANLGIADARDMIIPPRYVSKNKDERLGDALIAPFGAPASLVQGTVRGITDLIDGKTTQGAQELKRQLPLVGIPIWKDDVNAFVRARF